MREMEEERVREKRAASRPLYPAGALACVQRTTVIGIFLVAVVTLSLVAGYRISEDHARSQAAAVGASIGESIERVITVVRSNERKLVGLAGMPCAEVRAQLSYDDAIIPYLRSASLVHDGTLYCSTLAGARSESLSTYLTPSDVGYQVAFVGGTALVPQVPVMVVYHKIDTRNGILYVIEGAYITDILARAKASGAQSASVAGGSGGVLTSEGRWLKTMGQDEGHFGVTSGTAVFSIAVGNDPAKLRASLLSTEIVALVMGLSAFAMLATGYTVGFTRRQRLERQVRKGLRRREFFLEYQPIIEITTGRWVGAEALLRWNHRRFGLVMPGNFIDEIEQTAAIGPLTVFILVTALTELSSLPDGFRLNVNLAPHHTALTSFPDDVSSALARSVTRLQPVLEITERGLLKGVSAMHGLERLRAQGVKFAVDDFGTANSNLSLLQRFPFDYIKIDRQFIHNVASRDRQLIEGISSLANRLGAAIVAEGVEEIEQLEALKEIGVPFAQGFLFQRPLGIVDFEQRYWRSEIGTEAHPPSSCQESK
ncbi:putative cyclic di-GMP phosphodiesterase PdeN [Paraburkholderia domus]|nr:putative cyclic di-GMP phosphodiesterase PdeN [Paraburkholderia domus]